MDSKENSRWGWWEWFSWSLSLTLTLKPHLPSRSHCGPAMQVKFNNIYPGDDESEPMARLAWPREDLVWERLGGGLPPQHQLIRTALRLHKVIITTITTNTTINGCTQTSKKQIDKQTGFYIRPNSTKLSTHKVSWLTDWHHSKSVLWRKRKVKNAKKNSKEAIWVSRDTKK